MFKLVALFAVVALAAADHAVLPLAYSAGVLPYSAGVLPYSSLYPGYVSPYSFPYNYGFRAAVPTQAFNSPAVAFDPINKVPLDTPEVAAAKISHFQAKAFEASGIPAVPMDTPEVAAAKFSHFQAKAFEASGIPAVPLDTPEVAAAKISHLNAKTLELSGIHAIKKRSIVAPVVYSGLPHVTPYAYSAPWVSPYSAPVYASSLGFTHGYNSLNVHPY